MKLELNCGDLKFELVTPLVDNKMLLAPRIVHCHLCGWLWIPDTIKEPDYCAKCKKENYNKFPEEFDFHSSACGICRLDYEIAKEVTGEIHITVLKGKEPWATHTTPVERLRQLLGIKTQAA